MRKRTVVTVKLDTQADSDIIRWLAEQDNKSAAIRAAIRARIDASVTLADVYQRLVRLEDKLSSGVVVQAEQESADWDEPRDIKDALDALANL